MRQYIWAVCAGLCLGLPSWAQQADTAAITFGGLKGDPKQPVNVTSDSLTVDQAKRTAVFSGSVLVVQGEMRLSASEVRVEYKADADRIARLWASGDVLLVNAKDAAQAKTADYVIDTGIVTLAGDVVLTQGPATFTAQKFVANLTTGLGELQGGVRSTFSPSAIGKAAP